MTDKAHGAPSPGDLIAGKYRVESVLGKGGMGVVVAAQHLTLRRRVAVKFLLPSASQLPDANARFLREARAAGSIQSEHVAQVLDVGEMDNGSPYIVMEHLTGIDLGRLLKTRGALLHEDAVDFLLQALEAIAEAHALGIIHRDLKPTNLFVTARSDGSPLVKVLDFGLSKMTMHDVGIPEGSLTAAGVIAGSPHYMSPEQIRSLKHVDERADLWAMGVILYELLTAKRPFDGPGLTSICASVIADTPAPLRALAPAAPEGLDAVVMRCLEKDPSRRVASAAEMAMALAPFAPQRSWGSLDRLSRRLPGGPSMLPEARPPLPSIAQPGAQPFFRPSAPSLAQPISQPISQSFAQPLSQPISQQLSQPISSPTAQPISAISAAVAPPQTAIEAPDATTVHIGAWGNTGPLPNTKRTGVIVVAGLGAFTVILAAMIGWLVLARGDGSKASPQAAASEKAPPSEAPPIASPPVEAPPVATPAAPEPAPPAAASASDKPHDSPPPKPPSNTEASAPQPKAPPAKPAKPPASPAPPARPRKNPLDRSD